MIVTFLKQKNSVHDEYLLAYITQKLKNEMASITENPIQIDFSVTEEKKGYFLCEIIVTSVDFRFAVRQSGTYLYDCADRLVENIKSNLRERSQKTARVSETLKNFA